MENHPLNLAHQQHRRADAHLKNNRYDEAMECHHNAAELLLDAMKSTTSSVTLESITLQHSYHLKQKDLIKIKKEQYARVKKAIEHIKWQGQEVLPNLQGNEYTKLQVTIYKAINETNSLLHILSENKKSSAESSKETVKDVTDGKRTEKSQQTVVEELQILSQNLHSLVEQLVLQVEVLKDDNMTLKERVNYLEKERVKYLNLPSSSIDTFTTISMASEVYPDEPARKVPVAQYINRPSNNAVIDKPRQSQFDLSALKDEL